MWTDKDKEREAEREAEREHKEWLQAEEQRKQQDLKITYSYWDGMGHRRSLTVKQGDTVETFLKKVREQLMQQFRSGLRRAEGGKRWGWAANAPVMHR